MSRWKVQIVMLIAIATVLIVYFAIISERQNPLRYATLLYPTYYFILMVLSLLPCVMFQLKHKISLIIGSGVPLMAIVGHNVIHSWYNIDLYVSSLYSSYSSSHYIFSSFAVLFFVGAYVLKQEFEKVEDNYRLLKKVPAKIGMSDVTTGSTGKDSRKNNNELRQFLYTVSHNIKGPIANLKGLLSLIRQDSLHPENMEIIDKLSKTVSNMSSDINDLAYIIDVKNKAMQTYQHVSLREEIDGICILLANQIKDNAITVKISCDRANHIYSIRPMLKSILFNLISNSVKYKSSQKEPIIQISASWKNKDTILIEVEDNGVGMALSMEKKKQLFEPYKRFGNTPHVEGRGIGLFLVKLQVETLKGTIHVESEPEKGTRFHICLPTPIDIERQVIVETNTYVLHFNAVLSCLKTTWKKAASFDNLLEVAQKVNELSYIYKAFAWVLSLELLTKECLASLSEKHATGNPYFNGKSILKQLILLAPCPESHSEKEGSLQQLKLFFKTWLKLEVHCFSSETQVNDHIRKRVNHQTV